MTEAETSLWKGTPSQWLNAGPFIVVAILITAIAAAGVIYDFPWLFVGLLLPLIYGIWKILVVKAQVYELTNERLLISRGVINQHVDEIELYRVKDTALKRLWWMRITGLASIVMETSDRTMPDLVIPAIRGGREMRELLRKQVEAQRDKKRVREMDFDDGEGDEFDV